MNFEFSDKVKQLQQRLLSFMDEHVYPNEQRYRDEIQNDRRSPARVVEELKVKARAAGLRSFFWRDEKGGGGPTTLESPPFCKIRGRSDGARKVLTCSAPDTGNM